MTKIKIPKDYIVNSQNPKIVKFNLKLTFKIFNNILIIVIYKIS